MSRMRLQIVAVAALLITVGVGITKADTITTGDLSFACRGGCTSGSTAPTSSSFVYDHGQLSVNVAWDNIDWSFDFAGTSKNFFHAFIGIGAFDVRWNAFCIPGPADPPGLCGDNGIGFQFYLVKGCGDPDCTDGTGTLGAAMDGIGTGTGALPVPDQVNGTASANVVSKHSFISTANIISTPEPSVLTLLLSGLALLKGKKK
jgi:hypothetical protein